MTFRDERPDAGRHAHHDRLLIAAHAAGDLTGRDRERAEALLSDCAACRDLATELRAVRASTLDLPPVVRPAGLDFRLSAEQAARLDRRRGWRRLLRPFGGPSSAARPLAAAFTTLGLAGLLLAATPSFLGSGFPFAGSSGAAEEHRQSDTNQPASAPDPDVSDDGAGSPPADPVGGESTTDYWAGGKDTAGGEASDDPDRLTGGGPAASPAPTEAPEAFDLQSRGETPAGVPPLVLLSVGFLGAGLGLVVLRLAARRLG